MRTEVEILAAFDWLPSEKRIGTLAYESLRGNVTYQFQWDTNWLRAYPSISLSPDLPMVAGWQYSRSIFAFLQDALPDRWGRRLLDKRERIIAEREQRPPHVLNEADYLIQLDDTTRMGALRFCVGEHYWGTEDTDCAVPPVARLREFVDMAQSFEQVDQAGGILREQWLHNLYRQGSSLGGARPKATVVDTDGSLWVAKIPSINDDYDIALWEYWANCLAMQAGIKVTPTRLLSLDGQRYHTLLSKRFDRHDTQRIHFASAMTLCGLQDGADADSGNGYLDIVEAMIGDGRFKDVHASLRELYRRVAFNCYIGNHDDHFRNHGFLLTADGWVWSPVYDINPTNSSTQSLLISRNTNESSIDELLSSASDYLLTEQEATSIIAEVHQALCQWRKVAAKCGISPAEQQRFALRIDVPPLNCRRQAPSTKLSSSTHYPLPL